MTTTRSSSIESFYTAQSSYHSTDELSSIVNLNGKSYHLTVYHRKPGSDWEEITESYLEQAKGIDLQKILQEHIKFPYKNIEITTSVDLKAGFVCKTKDTDGIMRKVAGFNLTESQKAKVFAVLKKVKAPKFVLNSSSSLLSEENVKALNSSIKMSLEEIKTKRVQDYLENSTHFNQNCMESQKAHVKHPNKSELIVGFQNKLMNCGFNSCLQMIIHEPALLHIYITVANYYANSAEAKDKECGNQMLSVLGSYNQAIEEQKTIPAEVSNNLRLAMHYLSLETISSECKVQEDANEILAILFAKNDDILKEKNSINTSSINYKFEHVTHYLAEKVLEETPHQDCSSLNTDNTYRKEGANYGIKINFDSKQKNFTLSSLLKKYFCDKEIGIGSATRKYMVDGIYTEVSPVKEEIQFNTQPKDLYIHFARFKADQTKLTNPIEIPEQLDAKLLNIKDSPSGSYELSSFIVHLGSSLNGGHYIAYRKVQDQWIECNDGYVSPRNKKQALEVAQQSYMCFYRLKDE